VGGLLKKRELHAFLDTMKLLEALETLRGPVPPEAPSFRVFLAGGFTPLDWKTYVTAHHVCVCQIIWCRSLWV
jgi:hypothetical protein